MHARHLRFRITVTALAAFAIAPATAALAQFGNSRPDAGWRNYVDPRGGTSVDFPSNIFRVDAGETERGVGKLFRTEDGRAEFSIYSVENESNDTPQSYLRNNLMIDNDMIDYRRVTGRFFVVSGIREGKVFYSRCNFRGRLHCIYLSYPREQLRAWDRIVTRVSYSLRGERR